MREGLLAQKPDQRHDNQTEADHKHKAVLVRRNGSLPFEVALQAQVDARFLAGKCQYQKNRRRNRRPQEQPLDVRRTSAQPMPLTQGGK